jgi:anti-sigma B factor antagonist
MREHATTIHIDLSGVTFMDSTGLEALLTTRQRARLEGGKLHLIDPTHAVLRILEVSGVDRMFEVRAGGTPAAGPAAPAP